MRPIRASFGYFVGQKDLSEIFFLVRILARSGLHADKYAIVNPCLPEKRDNPVCTEPGAGDIYIIARLGVIVIGGKPDMCGVYYD